MEQKLGYMLAVIRHALNQKKLKTLEDIAYLNGVNDTFETIEKYVSGNLDVDTTLKWKNLYEDYKKTFKD